MKIDNEKEFLKRIKRIEESSIQTKSKISKGNRLNLFFVLCLLLAFSSYAFYKANQPTISIAADRMNVFYIGLQNPITVAVSGVNPESVTLESDKLEFTDRGAGHYFVKAKMPGKATIKVNIENAEPQYIDFRVKRIPDPMAMSGNSTGGNIKVEEFAKSNSLDAVITHFDYDAACKIESYVLTYVAKEKDPLESRNIGSQYEEQTVELLKNIKAGDFIYIDNVKCKCPGDAAARAINSLVFKLR